MKPIELTIRFKTWNELQHFADSTEIGHAVLTDNENVKAKPKQKRGRGRPKGSKNKKKGGRKNAKRNSKK